MFPNVFRAFLLFSFLPKLSRRPMMEHADPLHIYIPVLVVLHFRSGFLFMFLLFFFLGYFCALLVKSSSKKKRNIYIGFSHTYTHTQSTNWYAWPGWFLCGLARIRHRMRAKRRKKAFRNHIVRRNSVWTLIREKPNPVGHMYSTERRTHTHTHSESIIRKTPQIAQHGLATRFVAYAWFVRSTQRLRAEWISAQYGPSAVYETKPSSSLSNVSVNVCVCVFFMWHDVCVCMCV